jgi:hypothetical protein
MVMTLSSQQLAFINKIQFRFCDQQLGKKYNVDTLASFLFDTAEPKGSTTVNADHLSIISIPHDVMFRIRKTLLSVMNLQCTDPIERQYLHDWCDYSIFMDSRGRTIRHASHVREVIAEAVIVKESIYITIDSSACIKLPKENASSSSSSTTSSDAASGDAGLTDGATASRGTTAGWSTSMRRSPRTVITTTSPSSFRRPPLAPRHNVVSPTKKDMSCSNIIIKKKSPIKISDHLKKTLSLPLTENGWNINDDADNDGSKKEKPEHDSNENCAYSFGQDKSFNLEDLIDDCMGDSLLVAEPEDISPFLLSNDDDGLLSSPMEITSFHHIMDNDFSTSSPDKEHCDVNKERNGVNDNNNTHCFLLPSFFDESTSLMTTTGSGCCIDDSSLFHEHERDMVAILQSVMDIVDDTTMNVTV